MKKKYYIPTSSLNFNNILSTESISPKDFYKERGFGYSHWHTIPENDIPNVVLLYEAFRMFPRPESDTEDHPLLIEYVSDEDYPLYADGVHYTDRTIYLDPWNTYFIFFSDRDKNVALSMSDSSLETKLLRLYRKHIVVRVPTPEGQYPITDTSKLNTPTNTERIEFDRKVNKMKGLLYGYYIGAYLSISDGQLLDKMNILREISNIFASVISSIDKIPTTMQKERLSTLFVSMRKDDPIYNRLKEIIGDESATNAAIEFLEKEQRPIFDDWRSLVNGMRYDSKGEERAILWVNRELDKVNRNASIKRVPLSVDKKEIVTTDCQLKKVSESVIKDSTLRCVYRVWVNDVLATKEYNGKISPQKERLSDTLTLKAKDKLGDAWQGNAIQTFMNQLRRYVRGEEFNQCWDNGVLSSVASCLIKGDDWEQMLLFMQSKGMTDYRLAFSFYGVLNGFANLTRDFTDLLLNLNNQYVSDVYKEFAGQLLGSEIENATLPQPEVEAPNLYESPIGRNIIENIDNIEPKKGKQTTVREAVCKALDLEYKVQNPKAFMYILDSIPGIKNSNAFKVLQEANFEEDDGDYTPEQFRARIYHIIGEKNLKSQKEKIDKAIELEAKRHNSKAFMMILDNFLSPGNKPYKEIAKVLNEDSHKTTVKTDSGIGKSKANNYAAQRTMEFNSYFYNDPSTIKYLKTLIGENVEYVLWFFEDMKLPKGSRKYYKETNETDNKMVIDAFCKSKQISHLIGSQKIEQIRSHFYDKYGIRKD